MLEEFGMGVVESIAIKQTCRFRDCGGVSDWSRAFRRTRRLSPHAAQAVRPGRWRSWDFSAEVDSV
jgi:hypothetical protein